MTKLSLSIQSFDEYFTREKRAYLSWETMHTTGQIAGVRQVIQSSWKRCLSRNVNPMRQHADLIFTGASLKEQQAHYKWLLDLISPHLDSLFNILSHLGIVIVFANSEGILLDGRAHSGAWAQVEKQHFVMGSDWSESAAGTNAIGTAIVEGQPVQVFASEHFCQGSHAWVCSAAPIRDPVTREILGVIDITGKKDQVQAHSLPLIVSQVRYIEQALRNHFTCQEMPLLDAVMNVAEAPLLIFNSHFTVVASNSRAKQMLGIYEGSTVTEWLNITCSQLEDIPFWGTKVPVDVRGGRTKWLAHFQPYALGGRLLGGIVMFEEAKSVAPRKPPVWEVTGFDAIVTRTPSMLELIELAKRAALSDKTILITGETGVGKELLAQAIHSYSPRRSGPFIAVNCGALPTELVASELFGYEPGAFTGALSKGKKGKFTLADGGTIFLDEVGELSQEAQVYLLRVLEERMVIPVGGSNPIPIDVRVIAATHRNLYEEVQRGRFRADLYYRLHVIPLHIPPLRERRRDIPILVEKFLRDTAQGRLGIDMAALEQLIHYDWPGNIRQLKHALDQAVFRAKGSVITLSDLPPEVQEDKVNPSTQLELRAMEEASKRRLYSSRDTKVRLTKERIIQALMETNYNVTRTAQLLNISRMTVYRKMREYGITVDEGRISALHALASSGANETYRNAGIQPM